MTTFDFTRVREFADGINEKLDRCDHGERNACATVESSLHLYAACCQDFYCAARDWARDVFAGRVAFDATTEQMWLAELQRLYARAVRLTDLVNQLNPTCYTLDEERNLQSAVWCLMRLRDNWVTPRLAVGPSARRKLNPEAIATARHRIASLTLPDDWAPSDPEQRRRFHQIRSEQSKVKHDQS